MMGMFRHWAHHPKNPLLRTHYQWNRQTVHVDVGWFQLETITCIICKYV